MTFNEFLRTFYCMNVSEFLTMDYHETAPILYDYKRYKEKEAIK